MSKAKAIFDHLDKWRRLPAYQLERRADIFFALYMPEIIAHKFGADTKAIVPEFPIRVGVIGGDPPNNQSFKVDYLIATGRSNHFVFVELKTDVGSIRPRQDWYLAAAQKAGMRRLTEGVIRIYLATRHKRKYEALMALLGEAGLVEKSDDSYQNLASDGAQIDILYIQPRRTNGNTRVVTFTELAEIVAKQTDEISQRFARSLTFWEKSPAEAE
jgi:hypothetical protein